MNYLVLIPEAFYTFLLSFLNGDFVTRYFLIALAGLGMIYIIKSFIFIRRNS